MKWQISDNLQLQQLTYDHAKDLFNLVDSERKHLRKWMPWVDGTNSVEDIVNFIKLVSDQNENNRGFTSVILVNNRLCGVIGFKPIDAANHIGEIGYWLGKNFQGKGIMSLAVTKYIFLGFSLLNLNRIEISCAFSNKKSRKIPERLGFQMEACLKQREWLHDQYLDHALYVMLKENWLKKHEIKRAEKPETDHDFIQ